MLPHIENHILYKHMIGEPPLVVIGVCSNPARYHSRYRLAREWIRRTVKTPNVKLVLVEAVHGNRHHELSPKDCGLEEGMYDHLKLRVKSETWIKESLINIGARFAIVNYDAQYISWEDMDVFHPCDLEGNPFPWATETIQQLQTFEVVQTWQDCADLSPLGGISKHFRSFGFQHQRGVKKQTHPSQPYEYAHTGFGWACTRRFFEGVEGLMEFPILGSADHHMAFAMIGEVNKTIHQGMHKSFFRRCFEWQARALAITQGEVGFTPGRIEHWFHGPKNRRFYRERWQILVDHFYDPDTMLQRDEQGIARLIGNHKLEWAIRKYNRSRFEDSIEEY